MANTYMALTKNWLLLQALYEIMTYYVKHLEQCPALLSESCDYYQLQVSELKVPPEDGL